MDDHKPKYIIKVDGEELDHADTMANARIAKNALIYNGVGTEANTTIETGKRH